LEANSQAAAYTLHPCTVSGQYRCEGSECGPSLCDQGGCDTNSYRLGNQGFYGTGKTIDTSRKFTAVTQFITSNGKASGDLVEVRRLWVQDGFVYKNPKSTFTGLTGSSLSDAYCAAQTALFGGDNTFKSHGGMAEINDVMGDGMVLTFSVWVDHTAHMLWLDSTYPTNADPSKPGIARGPCPTDSGDPADILGGPVNPTVTFSNVKIGTLGSTYSGTAHS